MVLDVSLSVSGVGWRPTYISVGGVENEMAGNQRAGDGFGQDFADVGPDNSYSS